MVTKWNSPGLLAVAMMLAASFVLSSPAVTVAQEPTAGPSQAEAPPPSVPESAASPASEQKSTDGTSKNGGTEKKKGPIAFMLLGLFAVITGHQGTTR